MMRRRAYGDLERIELLVEVFESQGNTVRFPSIGIKFIDFGDGYTGTTSINHVYSEPGLYNITALGPIRTLGVYGYNYFGTIRQVKFFGCNSLTSLDFRKLSSATVDIDELNLDECPNITSLILAISTIKITHLDLRNFHKLKTLYLSALPSLDGTVLLNKELISCTIIGCKLNTLDVSYLDNLNDLNVSNNSLTELDVSKNLLLKDLRCYTNALADLDLQSNTLLENLYCYSNSLSSLDLSLNSELIKLECGSNRFTTLDDAGLVYLDVSYNDKIEYIKCNNNNIDYIKGLDTRISLKELYVSDTSTTNANRMNVLDLRPNINLEVLVFTLYYLDDLWLPTPDDNNSNKLRRVESGSNATINSKDLVIHNLSDVDMTTNFVVYYNIAGDYDLTKLKYGMVANYNTRSALLFYGSGHLKVSDIINRDLVYSKSYTNLGPFMFVLKVPTFEIVCEDGTIISDKKEYYKHIANVVVSEELYDYPQMCKIISPTFGKEETRELYSVVKTLACDSGMQNVWQNRGVGGLQTPFNNINFSPVFSIYVNKSAITKAKIVVKEGADFFITNAYGGYSTHDNRQRFIIENGELVGKNGASVDSKTVLENGDIEYAISAIFVVTNESYNYGGYAYVFENIYPSESDPYISKIVSFEKIE